MGQDSGELSTVEAKKYAIATWALARTRAELYSVLAGNVEAEEVKRILEVTSLRSLAERFGYEESELSVEWDDFLSAIDRIV